MSFSRVQLYLCNPGTARGTPTKLTSSKDKIVYTNGKTVIIHDLKDPLASALYSGHVRNTTVAKISPSGYYCASADVSGTVRVWDAVGEEQILKGEFKVIPGKIHDLDWDGESKRIIAVGDGRFKFGHAFMFDSGSSTGEIIGHSKAVNAVSIRHQRPFRAVTASDDTTMVFYHGTPYKYNTTITLHTKFVQDVRYSPSGEYFASVGSDAKIFLYNGITGETLKEFITDGHSGSIMACSWSPDSKSLVTSAADCTVKLWDIETAQAVVTWGLGSGVDNQQVGNAWTQNDGIVSLSMNSNLNVFDMRVGDKRVGDRPSRIIQAPQNGITAAASLLSGNFLVGTASGRVLSFSPSGEASYVSGDGHPTLVSSIVSTSGGKYFSSGFDDRVREIVGSSFTPASSPTNSQPKSLAVSADGTVFVAEMNGVEAIRDNQKVFELSTKFSPSSVAANGTTVADMKVRLYDWDGKALKEVGVLEGNKGIVSALGISPDGSLLAAGDSDGKVYLFNVMQRELITSRWVFHTGRINSISWTSDGKHCASGSLDTHVYIWSVQKPTKNIGIKNAGPGGVNCVFWLEQDGEKGKLASAGADGCVRIWDVTFHA